MFSQKSTRLVYSCMFDGDWGFHQGSKPAKSLTLFGLPVESPFRVGLFRRTVSLFQAGWGLYTFQMYLRVTNDMAGPKRA